MNESKEKLSQEKVIKLFVEASNDASDKDQQYLAVDYAHRQSPLSISSYDRNFIVLSRKVKKKESGKNYWSVEAIAMPNTKILLYSGDDIFDGLVDYMKLNIPEEYLKEATVASMVGDCDNGQKIAENSLIAIAKYFSSGKIGGRKKWCYLC